MTGKNFGKGQRSDRTGWQIFRWPLLMALASSIGLVAALIGDGWYDVVSWVTLGFALIVIAAAWRGWSAK